MLFIYLAPAATTSCTQVCEQVLANTTEKGTGKQQMLAES